MLDDLTGWVTDVIDALGYVGVGSLVALESIFPPIPSEVVLPLAGFVAGRGDASFVGMVLAATVGSVVGALLLYAISSAVGPVRLRAIVARYGRWFGIDGDDMTRAEEWFDRRSYVAVLVGRCIPLIRSIVSVPAGFRRMRIVPFVLLTALGSLVWNVALIGAGVLLGENWEEVGDVLSLVQIGVVVVVVGLVGRFLFRRLVRPRLVAAGDLPEDD